MNQFMARETCYFSPDYEAELKTLESPVEMAKMTKIFQFPYTAPVRLETCVIVDIYAYPQETSEKTEEEIAAALERRREQGKRLQEISARQRAEKVSRFPPK